MAGWQLKDGAAVITGASSGIGEAFARALAAQGRDLVITARREDRLQELAHELEVAHGVRVEVVAADLAADEGLARVEAAVREVDALAVLVNNAGFGVDRSFSQGPIDDHDAMVRVHALAPMRLMHTALNRMRDGQGGAIVNVSSVAAFLVSGGGPNYSGTKAYLNRFSQNLAGQVAKYRVHVQALCPGFTLTELHGAIRVGDGERPPLPRWLWLTPEKVVETSLRALPSGRVIVVTGWPYKLMRLVLALGLGRLGGWVRRQLWE